MITANGMVSAPPYWVAKLKDGTTVSESSTAWGDIADRVVGLSLNVDGMWHSLPDGMESYIQAKTMSSIVGSGEINVESRYIGFCHGNHEYYLRVDEHTRFVSIEIKEVIQ